MSQDIPNADLLAYWLQLPPEDVMIEFRSDVLGFLNIVRLCAELLSQEANARAHGQEVEPVTSAALHNVMSAFVDKTNELEDELDVIAEYIYTRRTDRLSTRQ